MVDIMVPPDTTTELAVRIRNIIVRDEGGRSDWHSLIKVISQATKNFKGAINPRLNSISVQRVKDFCSHYLDGKTHEATVSYLAAADGLLLDPMDLRGFREEIDYPYPNVGEGWKRKAAKKFMGKGWQAVSIEGH